MPLPVPNLDDRHFQDIVDQAKTLIPRYCPEWTDHNVSDPGVAMIELFAWMTDLLLYRVNQVPDKMYTTLLDLIGVRLQPPRAAQAPVTFYLSAAQPGPVTIPAGAEVATVQTETSPAIVFTTENDLVIQPATALAAYTVRAVDDSVIAHNLDRLALPDQKIAFFPEHPAPDDAFVLALAANHGHNVLGLDLICEGAGGAGVDPRAAPLQWQVWQGDASGAAGTGGWAPCELERDDTGGFNMSGEIVLRLPAMAEGEFYGRRAHWLRCRLTAAQRGPYGYRVSPDLERLRLEARGGTTRARHATTVLDEVLGHSDGTPGQSFALQYTPILTRDPARDYLVMRPRGLDALRSAAAAQPGGLDALRSAPAAQPGEGEPRRWVEVADFADSGPDDPHYTLDSLDGTLTLGPSLLQPDGSVYRFGMVPPRGAELRFCRYQHGGGIVGNLPAEALTMLKSSLPYVAAVTNWAPAFGGEDAQSLEDARTRAPASLRTRTRAVTADDYEYLAAQVQGVARARCLAPGAQPGAEGEPAPGQVTVLALPEAAAGRVADPDGPVPREALALSDELRDAVSNALDTRRLVGATLRVGAPRYVEVTVMATLRLPALGAVYTTDEVRRHAEAVLYRYLNPYVGGPQGQGWPFGRDLSLAEIHGLLQRLPSVDLVEDVQLEVDGSDRRVSLRGAAQTVAVPRDALLCSGRHQIMVRTELTAAAAL